MSKKQASLKNFFGAKNRINKNNGAIAKKRKGTFNLKYYISYLKYTVIATGNR